MPRVAFLLALTTLVVAEAYAIPPVPPPGARSLSGFVAEYGSPDFSLGSILAYRSEYAGLPADISVVARGDAIEELLFGFAREGSLSRVQLRRDADRVTKLLRVRYGPPDQIVRGSEFRTLRWQNQAGELVHTVVYSAGREQHYLHVSAR